MNKYILADLLSRPWIAQEIDRLGTLSGIVRLYTPLYIITLTSCFWLLMVSKVAYDQLHFIISYYNIHTILYFRLSKQLCLYLYKTKQTLSSYLLTHCKSINLSVILYYNSIVYRPKT